MIAGALMLLLVQSAAPAPVPIATADPRLARMAALYDEVCLKAFPDDAAVGRSMTARGATALTPAEVKVTLVDDPGRGWRIEDDGRQVLVFLELPPFHACSVRWPAPAGTPDWSAYRNVADAYTEARGDWQTMSPMTMDRGDIRIMATGRQRMLPNGGAESLLVIDQTITDPARRAAGETGVERRLVHQLAGAR